ncbi:MAG TPA: hypothetical protein VGK30_14320 [Candidatus Binatia bacterium]|jgi:hypothetical protein
MKKHLLGGLAAVLVVGISASVAMAQCAFEHPKSAKKFQGNFVQAFVSCGNPVGSNSPNTTTEGSVPACKPPETYSQQSGNTGTGWSWDELKASAQVQFKAAVAKPPVTPADSTDLAVKVKAKGIVDPVGNANGTGALATTARATFNDRMNGDITVVDFASNFVTPVVDGKINVKTSADALLNGISQPGLPHCSSIETVTVNLVDPNGDAYGNLGLFLK